MVARLVSTSSGLKVRRITSGSRDRRVLVVVDRRLYAPEDPVRWPSAPDTGRLLQARGKGAVFTARREIQACCETAFPDSRVTLLPHELIPCRRGAFARRASIRHRRFRRVPNHGHRSALVVIAATALICGLIIVLTNETVIRARARVEAVTELREERDEVARTAGALRVRQAELLTIIAGSDRDQRLSPGRLVDALAQVLANGEQFSRVSFVGNRLTVVVDTRDPGVAARIGTLPGVHPVSYAVHRRGGETIATIEAHVE